jgi:hypothetical protein
MRMHNYKHADDHDEREGENQTGKNFFFLKKKRKKKKKKKGGFFTTTIETMVA